MKTNDDLLIICKTWSLGESGRLVAGSLFGTRIFYVCIDGFDTHADQKNAHQQLLQQVGDGIASFFQQLQQSKLAERVILMTFSEFGRRMAENGSRGTDHGES